MPLDSFVPHIQHLHQCWMWDVDPVLLPIVGPVQVRWYGLAFLGVFYFGYRLLLWQMNRCGRGEAPANRFVNYGVVGLILGAWLAHRIFYEWDRLLENPLILIDVRQGLAGLSSHGAAAGLMVAMWLYSRKTKIPLGEMFDRFSFSSAMGAALVRLGNFFNSEIVGTEVNEGEGAWWAVCMPRDTEHAFAARHPSQLYEAAIGFAVLGLLVLVDRLAGGEKRPRWLLAGTFLVSYFPLRFLVEFFKEHQVFMTDPNAWDMGQWLSLPFAAVGVGFIVYAMKTRLPACATESDAT